jgi:predicted metal-binding membrane protein
MPMLSLGPFLLAWAVMMAAMMLPAVAPVVRLYNRAAAAGRVAPTAYFVLGYLLVWTLSGLPAFLLWQAMAMPLMDAEIWALRAAGGTLLAAGVYQVLPLKKACLRHCRSPMSYFMRQGRSLDRPSGAAWSGAVHGTYCFGCCVALMVVLVGVAAMQPWWAAVLAVVIYVERNGRMGEAFSLAVAAALIVLGGAAVIEPSLVSSLM